MSCLINIFCLSPAGVSEQQLVHVSNGCVSNDPCHLPYVKVGTVNFHSMGHRLDHIQSLRGTSKVEAVALCFIQTVLRHPGGRHGGV